MARLNIDVHKHEIRFEHALRRIKTDRRIIQENRELILRFNEDLLAKGITSVRRLKYLNILPKLSELLGKDFRKATTDDIKKLVTDIRQLKLAEWTKADMLIAIKRFYNSLYNLQPGQQPPQTSWIRVKRVQGKILPEELLSEEDLKLLLSQCENSRDRAFVFALFETGGRIAELLNLRRKHVTFDSYGAVLLVSGKTGDRRVRLISSSPALAQWMNDHPVKDPDSPLWTNTGDRNHGEPLLYDSARALLRRLAKHAGISKCVNPHAFRHSRASILANHLTERQMEQYLGWAVGSRMPGVYVHLSGRDVDNALLAMHGMNAKKEIATSVLQPLTCPRCNHSNGVESGFCSKCGLPLNLKVAMEAEQKRREADRLMSVLLDDHEVRQLILSKLRRIELDQGAVPPH